MTSLLLELLHALVFGGFSAIEKGAGAVITQVFFPEGEVFPVLTEFPDQTERIG